MERLFADLRFDAVINLAARAGVRASVEDPWIYYETNVTGTLNLLECCRRGGVKKFILASTSSVYGLNDVPFREDDNTDMALSPYAASKKAAEVLCHTYHYLYGLDISIPRYFTVYGPGGRPDMSIFRFMKNISEGRPIEVYGDGTQKRDFTYIDDIAEGTIRMLSLRGYQIINLGNSSSVELKDVIRGIEGLLERRAQITYLSRHPADVLATQAAIDEAEEFLGWKPDVKINEGLRKTVDWFLRYQDAGNQGGSVPVGNEARVRG
jgi:nucleoside-diphosphate-sugar epimerase